MVVASLVALVVERYLREELYADISARISSSLSEHRREALRAMHFQKTLPHEISDVVRNTVVEQPVIQRNVWCHFEMSPSTYSRVQVLAAKLTTSYELENVTETEQRTTIEEWTGEGDADLRRIRRIKDTSGFVKCTIEPVVGSIEPLFRLNREELRAFLSRHRGYVVLRREVTMSAKARARVTIEEMHYYHLDDSESYTVDRPTINLIISVTSPPNVLRFSGEPGHVIEQFFSSKVEPGLGQWAWLVNGALLPGQGISFEWEPV